MSEQVAVQADDLYTSWNTDDPAVRDFMKWLKRRGGEATADEVVAWDRDHGRRLFDWDNKTAAQEWRLHQARVFMNKFRRMFNGMRVRMLVHIREDADVGIDTSGYNTVEAIAEHPGKRQQVIDGIINRMKMLASELKMWKLSEAERLDLFAKLAEVMQEKSRTEAA